MFDKTDVYPYKRVPPRNFYNFRPGSNVARFSGGALQAAAGLLSPGVLLAGTAAFFAGRAVLLGELAPFAAAYAAAAAAVFGRRGLVAIAGLCAGLATVTSGSRLVSYVLLALLAFLFVQAVPPKYTGRWQVFSILVFGLTITVRASLIAFMGSTPYDYINIFFEGIFAAALTPACISAFTAARKISGVKPMNAEEIICLLLLVAGVTAGMGDLHLWYVSVKGVFSRVIILLAALAGGAGLGAAAGALVGIIPGLSYTTAPFIVGAYSFSGVMAGLGGMMGKVGVGLSFLASNIILSVYFNSFTSMESVIAETSLACLVFFLVPERLVKRVSLAVVRDMAPNQDNDSEALKNACREKTREYSSVFRELAGYFGDSTVISQKKSNENGIKQLLGEIGKRVCDGCGMHRVCWEKDYYRTYQNMLDFFSLTEVYGTVKQGDLPEELRLRCTRPRDLAVTASCLYQTFKLDRQWENKFSSGRGIVGEQLRGIAGIIESLGEEFDFSLNRGSEAGADLKQRLRQLGVPVKAIAMAGGDGPREMEVTMKACRGELDCRYRVAPLVSELMEQLYSASGCICDGSAGADGGVCRFRLYQGPQYRVEVGAARAGKDGGKVCGDVFDFVQLRKGRFAVMLSDGMGTGEYAARESLSTLRLVRRMLEAGLDLESAIKSVNSMLVLKNPGDSFATLDMSVINLYNGQTEFVKIAAPPTFLIRGSRVRTISASSLPVGIINDIEVGVTEKKLAAGDTIVMLTDGILDSGRGSDDKESWINGVLQELNGLEPREMAELLLKLAQTGSAGEPSIRDDMAVVVVAVEKEKVVEMPR